MLHLITRSYDTQRHYHPHQSLSTGYISETNKGAAVNAIQYMSVCLLFTIMLMIKVTIMLCMHANLLLIVSQYPLTYNLLTYV